MYLFLNIKNEGNIGISDWNTTEMFIKARWFRMPLKYKIVKISNPLNNKIIEISIYFSLYIYLYLFNSIKRKNFEDNYKKIDDFLKTNQGIQSWCIGSEKVTDVLRKRIAEMQSFFCYII